MKHGSEYARRIRQFFNQLRRQYGKPAPADHAEPIDVLIYGILLRDNTESKAQAAYRRLRESIVDHNELRVTPWVEVAETIGKDVPGAEGRARSLVDALNAIYDKHNVVDLGFLREKPVRDAREYLRSLPGVDEFTAARVVLLGLGGHAIPVDASMLELLRKEQMIDAQATIAEVQSFLEHHIPSSEAAEFTTLVHRHAASRFAKAIAGNGGKRPGGPAAETAHPRSSPAAAPPPAASAKADKRGKSGPTAGPAQTPAKPAKAARLKPAERKKQAPATRTKKAEGGQRRR